MSLSSVSASPRMMSTSTAPAQARADGPLPDSVPAAFAAVVASHGDRPALSCGERRWTYRELDRHSDAIARALIARGAGPGAVIGLYMGRSPETVAAILGVLKAGAAYAPFDPSYPPALLRFIREDSAPSLILGEQALLAGADTTIFGATPVLDAARLIESASAIPGVLPHIEPDQRAYVMYTSGSTGRPKGVQVPHRAILRLVLDTDYADFGADQTVLQLAPLAFDASTFELWAALLHGGRLAILPTTHPSLEDIAATIATQQVTTAWLTAGLFHLMVDHQLDGLQPLRQLLAGGDVLSVAHVDRLLAAHPALRLINGYGPTENTTFSCCYTIPRERAPGPIPIGRPIARSEAWVLDAAGQPVADGELGELYVGGSGLALGYLNRPELDAERFVPHPFDARPGARLYRSGDLVRRRADGNLEFHGRADRQVKINGKRVELDEIEAVLRRGAGIADAAVTVHEPLPGQKRLAAHVTAAPGATIALDALRAFLRAELPDYMQPASIGMLAALPLSPTGKVDRAKLPPPADDAAKPATSTPRTELEARLLAVWHDVLGSRAAGVDDNFFDLGGSSLQMMKVHAALAALAPPLPRRPTIIDLFTYPRISALAAWLAEPAARVTTAATATMPAAALERARRQNEALARVRQNARPKTP